MCHACWHCCSSCSGSQGHVSLLGWVNCVRHLVSLPIRVSESHQGLFGWVSILIKMLPVKKNNLTLMESPTQSKYAKGNDGWFSHPRFLSHKETVPSQVLCFWYCLLLQSGRKSNQGAYGPFASSMAVKTMLPNVHRCMWCVKFEALPGVLEQEPRMVTG